METLHNTILTELYEFTQSGGPPRRFTSALAPITGIDLNTVYPPATIIRDKVKQTQDATKSNVSLTVPITFLPAIDFRASGIIAPMLVTIFRAIVNEEGVVTSQNVLWKGRVVSLQYKDDNYELNLESIYTMMKRPGLRPRCETLCRHILFDNRCGADQTAHTLTGVVTATTGDTIVVSGLPSGVNLIGGVATAGLSPRAIKAVTQSNGATTVALSSALPGVSIGANVTFTRGCNHTREDCLNVFSNIANYGGFPYIPTRNPFGNNGAF